MTRIFSQARPADHGRSASPRRILTFTAVADAVVRNWRRFLVWFYRPSTAFWPCAALGVVLWSLPLQYGCGITHREELTIPVVAVLIAWYGGISLSAWLGERIAAATPLLRLPRIDEAGFYFVATLFSVVGVGASWYTIVKSGVPLYDMVENTRGNDLKVALYDNYSFLSTWRYSAALTGGIALFRLLFRDRRGLIDFLNVGLLLAAAVISARLLLVQSVFICFGAAVRFGGLQRFRPLKLLVFGGLGFVTLASMTWLREAGYYARFEHGDNPVWAQCLHVRRYVASPFQGAAGTARIAWEEPNRPLGSLKPWKNFLPTFLHSTEEKQNDAFGHNQWTLGQIDIDEELSTNSALAQLYGDLGIWCFPFMGLTALVLAWGIGLAWKLDNPLFLLSLIPLYGFFELWRMFLFNQGFVFFLLAEIVACSFLTVLLPWRRNDNQQFLIDRR